MNYADGRPVKIGDLVSLGGHSGTVVCSIDDAAYSTAYPETEWARLGKGVMIEIGDLGLIHYLEPEPDLQLVGRQCGS
jgi:hypothetical protein